MLPIQPSRARRSWVALSVPHHPLVRRRTPRRLLHLTLSLSAAWLGSHALQCSFRLVREGQPQSRMTAIPVGGVPSDAWDSTSTIAVPLSSKHETTTRVRALSSLIRRSAIARSRTLVACYVGALILTFYHHENRRVASCSTSEDHAWSALGLLGPDTGNRRLRCVDDALRDRARDQLDHTIGAAVPITLGVAVRRRRRERLCRALFGPSLSRGLRGSGSVYL
jgi:hypothetical protein